MADPLLGTPRRTGARRLRSPIVPHGASNPDPDPVGSGQSGPGHFRIYAPNSKFVPTDPCNHGHRGNVAQSCFAMGPLSNTQEGSEFRTLDISRYNERQHNWKRIDTFQTNVGHVGDRPLQPDIEETPSFCSFRPESLEILRRNVRDDLRSELHEVAAVLKELRKDVSQVTEEVRRVGDNLNVSELLAEIRGVKEAADLSPVLGELRKGEEGRASLLEEVRRVGRAMDLSPVLEQLQKLVDARKAKPLIDFSIITDCINEAKKDLSAQLLKAKNDAVLEGIRKFKTEVEPRPVQAQVDLAPMLHEIRQIRVALPFDRVFEEINKSRTDLQPVLAKAARIIEEVKKGKAEVLQEMQRGRQPPRKLQQDPYPTSQPDRRDFQLEITEDGQAQRVDFSLRGGEVLQIPVSPRTPPQKTSKAS